MNVLWWRRTHESETSNAATCGGNWEELAGTGSNHKSLKQLPG